MASTGLNNRSMMRTFDRVSFIEPRSIFTLFRTVSDSSTLSAWKGSDKFFSAMVAPAWVLVRH